MLDISRPKDHGNRESKGQPELVAKHGDGLSGVAVVVSVGRRDFVTGMWVRLLSVGFICHLIHLNSQTGNAAGLTQVFILSVEATSD
jgi:hypothetical protein